MFEINLGKPPIGDSLTRRDSGKDARNDLINLYWSVFSLPDSRAIRLNGRPHTVELAAIQGFTRDHGIVGFHTEPTHPAVTEIYFALSGRALAVVEDKVRNPLGPARTIQLSTVNLVGGLTLDDVDQADYTICQGPKGPLLRVALKDRLHSLSPNVIIPPGDFHGSLSAHDVSKQPRIFAIKAHEVSR